MLQSILSFRFSNTLLEQSWNNKFVESIEIRVLEKIGVEERGEFYDGLGAMRDVGQNHLLQMLALVTMDHPGSLDGESIRKMRAKVLTSLKRPTNDQIKKIEQFFSKRGIKAELYLTKKPKDATMAVKKQKDKYNCVIAAGGDGTINEVINGLANTDIPLGLIALGTENVLAKGLNIPTDPIKACEFILHKKIRKLFLIPMQVQKQTQPLKLHILQQF